MIATVTWNDMTICKNTLLNILTMYIMKNKNIELPIMCKLFLCAVLLHASDLLSWSTLYYNIENKLIFHEL